MYTVIHDLTFTCLGLPIERSQLLGLVLMVGIVECIALMVLGAFLFRLYGLLDELVELSSCFELQALGSVVLDALCMLVQFLYFSSF